MKLYQIVKQSGKRFLPNMGKAVALMCLMCFAFLTVLLVEQVLAMALRPTLINQDFSFNFSWNTLLLTIIPLILYFFIIKPFLLNIKKWNYSLLEEDVPMQEAMCYFGTCKGYFRAVWYSICKTVLITLIYLALLVPVMALLVALRVQIELQGQMLGLLFAVLFLLTGAFLLLAFLYATYVTMGFFFADYIYVAGIASKPFAIFRLSFQIAKNKRSSILMLWLAMIPLILLSCLIIPAFILVPLMYLMSAFFAKDKMMVYFTSVDDLETESVEESFEDIERV